MSKEDNNTGPDFVWWFVIIGIIFFLLMGILNSCNFPFHRATVVKDMGFFMIVEYKGTYYIINEDECERGIKVYDADYVYIKPATALDKSNEAGEN